MPLFIWPFQNFCSFIFGPSKAYFVAPALGSCCRLLNLARHGWLDHLLWMMWLLSIVCSVFIFVFFVVGEKGLTN